MIGVFLIQNIGRKMIKLNGYSGCEVIRISDTIVRKTSSSSDYNLRLIAQCLKQKDFRSSIFKTPKILRTGFKNNLFFFEYEYVDGIVASEFLLNCSNEELEYFKQSIRRIIPYNTKRFDLTDKPNNIFQSKLRSIKKQLNSSSENLVKECFTVLENTNFNYIQETPCHGDFTLENLIVKDNQIYLIDFLDSFYDSWLMDLAKLYQDVLLKWCYRDNLSNCNEQNLNEIFTDLQKYYDIHNDKRILKKLIMLNTLRILPYSKSVSDTNILYKMLELMLK